MQISQKLASQLAPKTKQYKDGSAKNITFCVTEYCNLACKYCLPAGTKILSDTYEENNIEDIKVGDIVLGFEEFSSFPRLHRKIKPSKVIDVLKRIDDVIEIKTKKGLIIQTTKNHPFLRLRYGKTNQSWKEAGKYKVGETLAIFPKIDFEKPDKNNINYKIGYFIGIMKGDGHIKKYIYPKSRSKTQVSIRIAMKDTEAINRVESYLKDLDIEMYSKDFKMSKKTSPEKFKALFSRAEKQFININKIIEENFLKNNNLDYFKGFLAGAFDAEGSYSRGGVIRISNTNLNYIEEIEKSLKALEIEFVRETNYKGTKNFPIKYHIRISKSPEPYYIKFVKSIEPAITRKGLKNILGKCLLSSDEIISIKDIGKKEVYNIETETHTYIANNFAVHNCYVVGVNKKHRLSKKQAIENINFIFDNPELFQEDAVIWEFIGGEPFLEIELIDFMCDYLKFKMYEKRPDWLIEHMFSFSTNGTLYHKPAVREFIKKNKERLSVGFSIDGVKEIHDKYRVYRDGGGSFDDVVRNLDLYRQDFGSRINTKATLSHDSLPFVSESVKHLTSLGLIVYMNVVFEDVWEEGDDEVFYNQLIKLADWLIESGTWRTNYVSLFDENLSIVRSFGNSNWCGSGKMLHISTDGKLYPCTRFAPYSMQYRKEGFPLGNVEIGFDQDRLSAFLNLTKVDQSTDTCINCKFESGCSWCTGWNYDKYGSIFKRSTFMCKMHIARYKANEYYFSKLEKLYGDTSITQ